MNDFLKTRFFFKGLLIAILSSFASTALAGGGGGGGGVGGNSTSVTCNDPFSFDINSGYVGDDPTTAAGSCGQCCFAGSDFDGDGQQDVSFSVENSEWFDWCNPTGSSLTVTVGFDEPGGGGLCNIQGAVWVGPSPLDATTMDCNNSEFDEFGSNPGGGADGFSFTVTVPAGECAYFMVDGYAGTTCAGVEAVVPCPVGLPIILIDFTAESFDNETVQLAWVTETEINNDFFTIERSTDGEIFEVIGIVDGAGNSQMVNSYDLEDGNPYRGTSYYRLKQTDYNGEYYYSRLIAVELDGVFDDVNIYPNPVEGLGYLSFKSNSNSSIIITIYDVSGRVVLRKDYDINAGDNTLILNTDILNQGMYFLTLDNGIKSEKIKFLKN